MNWSPQSSRDLRAWAVLRQFRAVLVVDLGNVAIDPPAKKTFEAEDAILERTLKSVYPIGRLRSKSWRTRLAGESTGRGRSSRKDRSLHLAGGRPAERARLLPATVGVPGVPLHAGRNKVVFHLRPRR
jgi:hypothetical protein